MISCSLKWWSIVESLVKIKFKFYVRGSTKNWLYIAFYYHVIDLKRGGFKIILCILALKLKKKRFLSVMLNPDDNKPQVVTLTHSLKFQTFEMCMEVYISVIYMPIFSMTISCNSTLSKSIYALFSTYIAIFFLREHQDKISDPKIKSCEPKGKSARKR